MSVNLPAFFSAARRVSITSVVWTVIASSVAIVLGISSGSLVLVVFGAVGYVDAVGSMALAHHFHHALRHHGLVDRFERRAHLIVSIGLVIVGAGAAVVSVVRLATGARGDASVIGAAVAAISLAALALLSTRKLWLARRVASVALRADGHLSMVGAGQAFVALAGVAATRWFGWHSADAVAALVVGCLAAALGVHALLTARTDPAPSVP
jgi:divalent metal cation (Fe/Co/Zn/Cd) transporter